MNIVQALLNAANRTMEIPAIFQRGTHSVTCSVAMEEDTEATALMEVGQAFHTLTLSVNSASLTDSAGNVTRPKRGDIFQTDNGSYKVVERGGVCWRNRFTDDNTRIMVFIEEVGA